MFSALRDLRRSPAYAVSATALLAAGFGAAFAIFSVFDAVLLRPLPFTEPDRLVALTETYPAGNVTDGGASAANAADWMNQTSSFSTIAAFESIREGLAIVGGAGSTPIRAAYVTSTYFETLGVHLAAGRAFDHGYEPGMVISHHVWLRHADRRADVVGSTLDLAPWGRQVVLGVMPEGFNYPNGTDTWFPTQVLRRRADGSWRAGGQPREDRNWSVIARLHPEATIQTATAELQQVAGRLAAEYPASNAGWSAAALRLQASVTAPVRPLLLAVGLSCVLLLVMTTTNSLNLALTRGCLRRTDMEIRSALGATRAQLFMLVLAERATLGAAGATAGLLVGWWLLQYLRAGAAVVVPRIAEVRAEPGTVAAVLGSALLLSLCEAGLLQRRWARAGTVRHAATSTARSAGTTWLVSVQVAVSIVLLVVAAAAMSAVWRFRAADRGYRPDDLAILQLTEAPRGAAETPALGRLDLVTALHRYVDAARNLPRVARAALVSDAPFNGETWSRTTVSGGPGSANVTAGYSIVSRDFVGTLDVTLLAGRDFDRSDVFTLAQFEADPTPPVSAIVNRSLARRLFGHDNPIGENLYSRSGPRWTIVGVIADTQLHPGTPARPEMYVPLDQAAGPLHHTMIARMLPGHGLSGLSAGAVAVLRGRLPGVTIFNVRTASDVLDSAIPAERVASALMRVFALVAFAVSVSGLVLIVSLVARSARRSIAIRRVLGAGTWDVARVVCRQAFWSLGAGVAVGVALSLATGGVLVSEGYWTEAPSPGLLALTAALFVLSAAFALAFPTRSAARIDPAEALKTER